MALRDLFDGDSRSKQQLRDEIQSLTARLEQVTPEVDTIERVAAELASSKMDVTNLEMQLKNETSARSTLKEQSEQLKSLYADALRDLETEVKNQGDACASAKAEVEQLKCLLSDAEKTLSQAAGRELAAAIEKVRVQKLESSFDAIYAEHESMGLRESTLYRNLGELQRREEVLAKDLEKLAFREHAIGAESRDELQAKTREIEILRTDLRGAERELRESKFLYEAMFQPYKEKAIREGRPVVDVQVADLQSKLFEATEEIRELTEKGAPDLRKAKQEVAELRLQVERQRQDIRVHDKTVLHMQRRAQEAEDKAIYSDENLKSVRAQTWKETSRLVQVNTANSESLQEKERELSGLKRGLQSAQNKVVTLEAFHKSTIQEKEREIVRLKAAIESAGVLKLANAKKPDFPDKWKDHRILSWMLAEANAEDCDVEDGYLALIGSVPWKRSELGELMESAGFSLWALPDADVRHVVVGAEGWTPEELELQIEAVEGEALRIYSQEMWFAFLVTGRDPFDSDEEELLLAFAEGHPALQYLLARDMAWPDVSAVGGGVVVAPPPSDFGVLESPMHMLDYKVGATSPHDESSRREILRSCFNAVKLPFGDDCSKSYRAGWGTAGSTQRLYRMALHIKHLIEGPSGRDYRRPQAAADWLSDLEWLKVTYFKKPHRNFDWPSSYL